MTYITHTSKVKSAIALTKNYPLVDLEINVDGTACLLVKYADRKYFETKLSREKMKMSSNDLAKHIITRVESYFNGWAAKKGLVKR